MSVGVRAGRGRVVALAAVLGGLLVAGGAFLPWVSFYAGLYPVRGVAGLWGRLLAVGGGGCVLAGGLAWWRSGRALERTIAVLGCALTAFTAWLVLQLVLTVAHLRADPMNAMLVPRAGPGLFVVLAGTLVAGVPAVAKLVGSAGRRAVTS